MELALHDPDAIRGALRGTGGTPAERANAATIERLLASAAGEPR